MKAFVALLMVLSYAAGPAHAQSGAGRDLFARLAKNYPAARDSRLGLFRMPPAQKTRLDSAHLQVLLALRRGKDAEFRVALTRFWQVPRDVIAARAGLAKGFTYGSGGGGSSDVAAKGFNDGASVALAGVERAKTYNAVICTYFYGSNGGRCDPKKIETIYRHVTGGSATIFGLNRVLNN